MKSRIMTSFIISILMLAGGCTNLSIGTDPPETDTPYRDTLVTQFFKRETGLVAGDGGFSIPLPDERVLWLFGDSFIDHFDPKTGTIPCLFQVRNAGLIQPAGNWEAEETKTLLQSGQRRDLFHRTDDPKDRFFWPGSGLVIGDSLFIYMHSFRNTGTGGPFGFEAVEPEMWARAPLSDPTDIIYIPLPDMDGISFGEGFVIDEQDRYVYAYGSRLEFIEGAVFVARFPMDHPLRWTFWDGETWQPEASKARKIGMGASNGVHVSKIRDQYLLLSAGFSVACDQGKEIYAAVSRSPTGPFSERKIIYELDDTVQGHYPFFYLPVAHPHDINEQEELLITYSINGYEDCLPNCTDGRRDPDTYRLQAFRMPVKTLRDLE